jgi:hypothetical protein
MTISHFSKTSVNFCLKNGAPLSRTYAVRIYRCENLKCIIISTTFSSYYKKTKNSLAWFRERTIPTERPPLVGEVSDNFLNREASCGQRDGSLWPYLLFSRPELLLSIKYLFSCTHEAEWTPLQTHCFSENLVAPGIEPGSLNLQSRTQTTRPQRRLTELKIWLFWLEGNYPSHKKQTDGVK